MQDKTGYMGALRDVLLHIAVAVADWPMTRLSAFCFGTLFQYDSLHRSTPFKLASTHYCTRRLENGSSSTFTIGLRNCSVSDTNVPDSLLNFPSFLKASGFHTFLDPYKDLGEPD